MCKILQIFSRVGIDMLRTGSIGCVIFRLDYVFNLLELVKYCSLLCYATLFPEDWYVCSCSNVKKYLLPDNSHELVSCFRPVIHLQTCKFIQLYKHL